MLSGPCEKCHRTRVLEEDCICFACHEEESGKGPCPPPFNLCDVRHGVIDSRPPMWAVVLCLCSLAFGAYVWLFVR